MRSKPSSSAFCLTKSLKALMCAPCTGPQFSTLRLRSVARQDRTSWNRSPMNCLKPSLQSDRMNRSLNLCSESTAAAAKPLFSESFSVALLMEREQVCSRRRTWRSNKRSSSFPGPDMPTDSQNSESHCLALRLCLCISGCASCASNARPRRAKMRSKQPAPKTFTR